MYTRVRKARESLSISTIELVPAHCHTRVARSLAQSARARIGWPFVRKMMIGALLGALMVLTMEGRAEASCSGCSSSQYCQYGAIYDSCESCPNGQDSRRRRRCTSCGSKTSPVHGSGTCPVDTSCLNNVMLTTP
jgi:hypothetical protein